MPGTAAAQPEQKQFTYFIDAQLKLYAPSLFEENRLFAQTKFGQFVGDGGALDATPADDDPGFRRQHILARGRFYLTLIDESNLPMEVGRSKLDGT
jgi:hypothetical protein